MSCQIGEPQEIPPLTGAPQHLRENHGNRFLLMRWANFVRGYYGVPVYLVGSALLDFNSRPRDWDVRIFIDNEQFARRFGDRDQWEKERTSGMWTDVSWKWSDECVKRSREGAEHTHLNVDFQILPQIMRGTFNTLLRIDNR